MHIPIRGAPFSAGNKLTLWRGDYESAEIAQLHFLKEGMNVIEFGSSLGILSAIMSKNIGYNGKLISVEASSDLVQLQKYWLLGQRTNVIVLNGFAFPLESIPVALDNLEFNPAGGSLCGRVEPRGSGKSGGLINVYSISDINKMFERGADCLICDIEGSEEVIIEYGFSLPDTIMHILIELHPWIYKKATAQAEIIDIIESSGFNIISNVGSVYYFKRNV